MQKKLRMTKATLLECVQVVEAASLLLLSLATLWHVLHLLFA